MVTRSLGVGLLFVAAAFAGCLGGGDDDVGPAGNGTDNASLNTDAPGGRNKIVAFEETNMTESGAGGVDHHHDNWQGRDRVLIFEKVSMMEPFPDTTGTFAIFRPPLGATVFEGTATVEFTLTAPKRHVCEPFFTVNSHFLCTDNLDPYAESPVPAVDEPNPPAGLKLRYKHASTVEWIDAGEFTWNEPSVITITNATQTDMPHATSSAWEFMVVSPNPQDSTLMFTAKAEIVRAVGENIPLWPGHPLFYDENRTSRIVVDNVEAFACDDGFGATACTLGGGDPMPIKADKLVSYGTKTLHIWANVTSFQMPNPATAPNSIFVYHNNATGRQNATRTVDAANYPVTGSAFYWALPVDDGGMDSPYADGSKWAFRLGASYVPPENPVLGSCYGGCAEWYATYTLTVIASSIELPPAQYHMACLDGEDYCPEPGEPPA